MSFTSARLPISDWICGPEPQTPADQQLTGEETRKGELLYIGKRSQYEIVAHPELGYVLIVAESTAQHLTGSCGRDAVVAIEF
jgi:hypothetical protein